ncbi:MAG: hypothetical protein BA873_14385 [Desulfobulbaceae bacterium C00003063]|nr:MAG: hypothetical protein BA873_14385 [Desulfobulbaceae bacterium C00003063]
MKRPGSCLSYACVLYEKSMVATPWKSGYRLDFELYLHQYSQLVEWSHFVASSHTPLTLLENEKYKEILS